jgi:hypothetical protein
MARKPAAHSDDRDGFRFLALNGIQSGLHCLDRLYRTFEKAPSIPWI